MMQRRLCLCVYIQAIELSLHSQGILLFAVGMLKFHCSRVSCLLRAKIGILAWSQQLEKNLMSIQIYIMAVLIIRNYVIFMFLQ